MMHEKILTKVLKPSDLKKLLIPRVFERHFPQITTKVRFFDGDGKEWQFQYLYYKNKRIKGEHVYYTTRRLLSAGWTGFVKEKGLKPEDTIIFYKGDELQNPYFLIDIDYKNRRYSNDSFLNHPAEEKGEKKRIKLFGVWLVRDKILL